MYVYQSQQESGGWGEGEVKFKEETHWEILSNDFRPWQPLRTLCHWCVSLHSGSQLRPHLEYTQSSVLIPLSWNPMIAQKVHININLISSLTWEDVSIVPLSRSEDAAIFQSHWIEWTATGKKTSTLLDKTKKSVRGLMADGKEARTTGRVFWLDRNS